MSDWRQEWGSEDDGDSGAPHRPVSLARFVSGGAELIDNNNFFHCGEYVGILGNRLIVFGVPYIGIVSRNSVNWGWEIKFDNMTPKCIMRSSECYSEYNGNKIDREEPLRSPLAMLPRYALYPGCKMDS